MFMKKQPKYPYFNNNNNSVNIKLFDNIVHYFHLCLQKQIFYLCFDHAQLCLFLFVRICVGAIWG